MTRFALRTIAIVIAVLGAIDPAITSMRTSKPEMAVVAAQSGDDSAANRVAQRLAADFTVIRAPFAAASATVVVGTRVPRRDLASPVFAVFPERRGAVVTFDSVEAPPSAPADGRVPVVASVRATGARGRTLELTLRVGDLVIDRATRSIASDDETQRVALAYVPTAAGMTALRVDAQIVGTRSVAACDLAVDVRDTRWAVLFFDRRPSWMSTFVRRSIERDARFVVTSRVVTSRNVSTDVGRPPESLDDVAALSLFDAVVVGAPEALTDRDVAGLQSFLRRRGGGVVMLFDQRATGKYEPLTEVVAWEESAGTTTVAVEPANGDSGAMRASEFAWPSRLPAGAELLASSAVGKTGTPPAHPVVWRSSVGAGRLVVSGALDAWRFRDVSVSSFDSFWRSLLAETADGAHPAIEATATSSLLAPGERASVEVTLRDAALATLGAGRPAHANAGALMESGREAIRLWPDGGVGQFTGAFRAPLTPGAYRVSVMSEGARAEIPVVVAANVVRANPDERDLLTAWTASRGGIALPESQFDDMRAALSRALNTQSRRETWHPMRSPWWILPFAIALGAEWWIRRRRGLP